MIPPCLRQGTGVGSLGTLQPCLHFVDRLLDVLQVVMHLIDESVDIRELLRVLLQLWHQVRRYCVHL